MKLNAIIISVVMASTLVGCSTANVHQTTTQGGTRTVVKAVNGASATVTTANGGTVTVNSVGY